MMSGTAECNKCPFGQLNNNDTFQYRDQLYRKDGDDEAVLLRWASGEPVTSERVAHRFFAEIVVQRVDA